MRKSNKSCLNYNNHNTNKNQDKQINQTMEFAINFTNTIDSNDDIIIDEEDSLTDLNEALNLGNSYNVNNSILIADNQSSISQTINQVIIDNMSPESSISQPINIVINDNNNVESTISQTINDVINFTNVNVNLNENVHIVNAILEDNNEDTTEIPNNNRVSKSEYLKQFNSKLNGDLHEQSWVQEAKKDYLNKLSQLKQHFCSNCHELWPSLVDHCKNCSKNNIKFSKRNEMLPDFDQISIEIKKNFELSTPIEEM